MKNAVLFLSVTLLAAACTNPAEPRPDPSTPAAVMPAALTPPSAPSFSLALPATCAEATQAWALHPNDLFYINLVAALCRGTGTTPPPLTCQQLATLAYGPYTGSNVYYDGLYRARCGTPPRAPTPPPPPTYPAPRPTPTCSYSRTGCTKTAGNN